MQSQTSGNDSSVVRKDLDAFHQLVADLNTTLGPTGGIAKDDVDTETLLSLMRGYESDQTHWQAYAFGDRSRAYTRNLVDRGNVNSNLLLLVWSPGRESPVHDHADAHCVMKILKGTLKETRFAWPEKDSRPAPMKITKETIFMTNEVSYMSDELGLHCISNLSPTEFAYSLHLYTPPNASKEGCLVFERDTGKQHHITMCNWYSELGRKCEPFSCTKPSSGPSGMTKGNDGLSAQL